VRFHLLALLLLLPSWAARAQTRPLLTEEATTAPAGRIAFETGGDFIASEPNYETGHPRGRGDGPLLRIVYSPADSVEVDLEWVAFILTPSDPDFGHVSDAGDVSLRTKLRFHDGGARGPTFGARFTMTLPQTSFGQGLGPNTTRTSAQALLTLPAGPLRVHLNAGLAIQDEVFRAHEQRDFLAHGAALEWRAGARLALVAEIAGLAGKGAPGTDAHTEVRAGLRLERGRGIVDAAVRRGLGDADGTWGATAGLTWTLRGAPNQAIR
jgi:hypothetical protein